jgi:hypothetical protein
VPRNIQRLTLTMGLLGLSLVSGASAQFDPSFNNLRCYDIRPSPHRSPQVNLVLENQFGRERAFKLTPKYLCVPTRKLCCTPPGTSTCSPSLCNAEPAPTQPAPVDHFKCYTVIALQCVPDPQTGEPNCLKLKKRFPAAGGTIEALLRDQFEDDEQVVRTPRLLCVPVLKVVGTTTTSPTTTTTTTTTTITTATTTTTTPTMSCHLLAKPDSPAVCGGHCPPGLECVNVPAQSSTCACDVPCNSDASGACGGFCSGQAEACEHATCLNGACCCCGISGAPCTSGFECCSGECVPATQTCQ